MYDAQGQPIQERLSLPEYQRPYRWSSSQVAQLAEDIGSHQRQPVGHHYYLGSLVLHQTPDGCLNIVDGQQRITSVGILCLLAGIKPLPTLRYSAPESQQRIRQNLAELRQQPLPAALNLEQINVTLVITRSQDDAYRFFETQNSGGVRLSGIDIAKAYHLRALEQSQQNHYARRWEGMGELKPVVDCVMRGRFWQSLDWRDLPSQHTQAGRWRDEVIAELADSTAPEGGDWCYRLQVSQRGDADALTLGFTSSAYDMRQPLQAGCNSIHYLEQYHALWRQHCADQPTHEAPPQSWPALYQILVAQSDASLFLRKLFDTALVMYVSRFGDTHLREAGLWLFRMVYSLRLSNERMVRESSVQKFAKENPLLDWIAQSYTPAQLMNRLRAFGYRVDPKNLEKPNGKKRQHVDAVCQALHLGLAPADTTPKLIEKDFDNALRLAIEHLLQPQHTT
jgi:hypothetical protein